MKIITVLGNFSGRNAGDNAILGNLLDDISAKFQDVQFLVPTFIARFVKKHFNKYNIKALGLMPWNFAFKIFGVPTFKAMLQADLILITDNILFDRKFFNPLFNYLSTISLIAPFCKKRGIPIIPYNASLGPINTERGRLAMQKILDASSMLILRDQLSKQMLDQNNLKYPEIHIGADCAINTRVPNDLHMEKIIKEEGLFKNKNGTISFNINAYIDSWQRLAKGGRELDRNHFVKLIGNTLDKVIEDLDVDIVYVVTQVMDLNIVHESLKDVKHRDRISVVSNQKYTYQELTGIFQRAEIHVGMRTHSLILAAAAITPMVNINAYPKSAAFLETIGQNEWIIEFEDLSVDNLTQIVKRAWNNRVETKKTMESFVRKEQEKAKKSVELIGHLLH
jgi:polysaccharide pyruvyl transferase WcaK-like protein